MLEQRPHSNTDIVICEDESNSSFCAVLTCNQDSMTKLLRAEVSHCPVEATRTLVDRLQKDTAKLFSTFLLLYGNWLDH
jgi:hypothetical protein